jgi:GNAT superfamily N-acetyltransferase
MESARVAGPGDLARMAELAGVALEEAATRRGGGALVGRWRGTDQDEIRSALAAAMVAPGTRMWVGTIDEAVVGITMAVAESGSGQIPLMFVEPEARGVGVGEALLEQATVWLAEEGCGTIDISVLPGDRDTKQFLEGSGMVARLLVMSRTL